MARFIVCDQSALERGGHYLEYTLCAARAAGRARMAPHVLCNARLADEYRRAEGIEFHSAYSMTWGEAEARGLPAFGPGNSIFETVMALVELDAGSDDHVLLHTLAFTEIRGWLEYLVDLPWFKLRQMPALHLLMRFDPAALEEERSSGWLGLLRRLGQRGDMLAERLHLCCDTEPLARRYAKLLGLPVSAAPIPFEQAPLLAALERKTRRDPKVPVTVLYLGDARPEKGFDHFPALLRTLWDTHVKPRKLRFVFQANLNTPGGEGGTAHHVRDLGQYPKSMVELIREPMVPEEYFRRLADADIVLVPYSPERYRARSSGVLVEALAAGKPVITTAGSWMASQVDPQCAHVISNHEQLPGAVAELAARLPEAAKAARRQAGHWQRQSSPDNFVAHLLENAPRPPTSGGPSVLFVMDADAMVLRNGASRVARRQLDYLFKRGCRVHGLFVVTHLARHPVEAAAWTDRLGAELRDFPFECVHGVSVDPAELGSDKFRYLAARAERGEYSILRDIRYAEALSVPASLLRRLRRDPPNLVLLNYATYRPLLDTLGLGTVPVVCETHDIQSFQKAIYGKRPTSDEDIARELALLGKCQYLISLNDVETAWIAEQLPRVPCATVPMAFDALSPGEELLAGYTDLADLVAGCRPEDAALARGDADSQLRRKLIAFGGRLDLFYVSSSRQSNVSGLRWFIDKVFLPRLAPQGITMIVAGSIKQAAAWPDHPGLAFVGKLEDLAPLYAAAKLCVVPIVEAAGSPVKTFEAVAHGKPVVGTGLAFRGLPAALMPLVSRVEEEKTFAAAVEKLVADPALRQRHSRRLRSALGSLFTHDAYKAAMDKALRIAAGVRSRAGPRNKRVPTRPQPRQVCEWGQPLQAANQLLRGWLGRAGDEPFVGAGMEAGELQAALRRMLPLALEHGPLAILDASAKSRLLADPTAAIEALFVVAGLDPIVTDRTPHRLTTRLVVSGIARNTLSVQLVAPAENTPPPRLETTAVGRQLEPIGQQRKGENLFLHYQVPEEDGFPYLWPLALSLELTRNSPWKLGQVVLRETLTPTTLVRRTTLGYFHNLERDPMGRPFVWTAAQTIELDLQFWRGTKKNLLLECYALRNNTPDDVTIKLNQEMHRATAVSMAQTGVLAFRLDENKSRPLPKRLLVSVAHFDRASESDERMIGISLLGLHAICSL